MIYWFSAFSTILSLVAIFLALWKNNVNVQVINVEGHDVPLRMKGTVIGNVLRLEADGESIIVSDKLLPLHNRAVTVVVLLAD